MPVFSRSRLAVWGILATLVVAGPAWPQEVEVANEPAPLAQRLGYPPDARLLIVHADDLGVAHSINRASMDALTSGRVNSASIMVPCPWFPEVAAFVREHPEMDIGLHLTLTSEWRDYRWDGVLGSEQTPSLHDEQGFLYADTPSVATNADIGEAERELRAQIERAKAFGIEPTHLDPHMASVLATPQLMEVYRRLGREYAVPVLLPRQNLRFFAPQVLEELPDDTILVDQIVMANPLVPADQWETFYTEAIRNMQPGVTQIIIHLAYDDLEMQAITADSPAFDSAWRQRDTDFFTSERFSALLEEEKIELITWRQIGKLLQPE